MKGTMVGCGMAALALALALAARPAEAQDLQTPVEELPPPEKKLAIPSSHIQVQITNSNYQRMAP
jgi:hypothetical protein